MAEILRVLLIEDAEDDAELVMRALRQAGYEVNHERVENAEELQAALEKQAWDIILSDYHLPSFKAPEALALIRLHDAEVPFILLSGTIGEDIAVEMMKAGAQDFFLKRNLTRLASAVARELKEAEERLRRRRAEEQLRQSENRFAKAFHASPLAISISTLEDGTCLDVNDQYLALLGYKRQEVIGHRSLDLGIWESTQQRDEIVRSLSAQRTVHNREVRHRTKGGEWRDCLSSYERIELNGEDCILAMSVDISERKLAERRLQASEERYRTIVEQQSEFVTRANLDGKRTFVNQAYCKYVGLSYEECLEQENLSFVHPEDRDWVVQNIASMESDNPLICHEHRVLLPDGRVRWQEWSNYLIVDEHGRPYEIQGVGRDITDQKLVEEALRQRTESLQRIFDYAPIMMVIRWTGMPYAMVNKFYEDVIGYTQADIAGGLDVLEKLYPDSTARDAIRRNIREATGEWNESRLITRDGKVLDTSWINVTLQDGTTISLGQDITERKQAEDELRALYAASSFLYKADSVLNLAYQIVKAVVEEFSQADCGVLLVNRMNNTALRLARAGNFAFGITEPLNLNEPSLIGQAVATGQVVYAPDVRIEPNYHGGDSRTRSELVVPLKTAEGVIGVLDLQSERLDAFGERSQRILLAFAERAATALHMIRLNEQLNLHTAELETRVALRTAELQRIKERVEAILNSSPDAILLLSPGGTVEAANPAFVSLFGYEVDALYRKPLAPIMAGNNAELAEAALARLHETSQVERISVVVRRRDGSTFDADVALSPIREDNRLSGIVCTVRDITFLKEIERMKDAFVSNVSHELRTPITGLKLNHRLIEMNPEKSKVYLERLGREIDRLNLLIEDLLRLSRLDQGRLPLDVAPVDLNEVAAEYLYDRAPLAEANGLELRLDMTPDLPLVMADRGLIGQVLSILLTNAINYTPRGGKIFIETLAGNQGDVPEAGFRVSDAGHGIADEEVPFIFDRFYRGKVGRESGAAGTGLGLPIARQIVQQHRGEIVLQGRGVEGRGATFTVWLPTSGPGSLSQGEADDPTDKRSSRS